MAHSTGVELHNPPFVYIIYRAVVHLRVRSRRCRAHSLNRLATEGRHLC